MEVEINSSTIVENDKDGELMEPWAYFLAAAVLLVIGILGFTLNLFVIVLMWRNTKLWTPMNIILLNLICSDFSVSVIGNPITLTASIAHGWIFGRTLCKAYGFFMALLGITSITTLTVLAYERYSLITYPLTSHQLTIRGAFLSVFLIWLYSLLLTAPPLFGWGAYVNEAANISCSVNWETQTWNATTYIVYLFCFGLVIPMIVITFSYLKIAFTVKQTSVRLGKKSRAERRVAIMIAVMIIAFLVAWTPYAIFALIGQFGPKDFISPAMGVMPALLAKSSICYNPMIYVGLNKQMRSSLMQKSHADSTVMETVEHHQSFVQSSNIAVNCSMKTLSQTRAMLKPKVKVHCGRQPELEESNDDNLFKDNTDSQTTTYLTSNSNIKSKMVLKELTVCVDGQTTLCNSTGLTRMQEINGERTN